jgi:hypothetical protein
LRLIFVNHCLKQEWGDFTDLHGLHVVSVCGLEVNKTAGRRSGQQLYQSHSSGQSRWGLSSNRSRRWSRPTQIAERTGRSEASIVYIDTYLAGSDLSWSNKQSSNPDPLTRAIRRRTSIAIHRAGPRPFLSSVWCSTHHFQPSR